MDNSCCSHCQELLKTNKERNHPSLLLISSMPHSELYKCDTCKSYLHKFGAEWEMLISGSYRPPKPDSIEDSQMQIDFLPPASGQQ